MKLLYLYIPLFLHCALITTSDEACVLRTFNQLPIPLANLEYLNEITSKNEQDLLIRGLDEDFSTYLCTANVDGLKIIFPNHRAKNNLLKTAACNMQVTEKKELIYAMLARVEKLQSQQFFLPGEINLVEKEIESLEANIEKNKQELLDIVTQQHESVDMYGQERSNT